MAETNYLWDEMEDNVIEEYDDLGNTNVSYTTEPTLYGPVLSQDRGGQIRHYFFDGLGCTSELTDTVANVTDYRRYTAFGETSESSGQTIFAYQFLGRNGMINNSVTDYFRWAYLARSIGRWTSLYWPGEPRRTPKYLFSMNNGAQTCTMNALTPGNCSICNEPSAADDDFPFEPLPPLIPGKPLPPPWDEDPANVVAWDLFNQALRNFKPDQIVQGLLCYRFGPPSGRMEFSITTSGTGCPNVERSYCGFPRTIFLALSNIKHLNDAHNPCTPFCPCTMEFSLDFSFKLSFQKTLTVGPCTIFVDIFVMFQFVFELGHCKEKPPQLRLPHFPQPVPILPSGVPNPKRPKRMIIPFAR